MMNSRTKENFGRFFLLTITAVLIGLLVGAIDMIFGQGLLMIGEFRGQHWQLILFLAVAGLVICYLYKHFGGKTSKGMGLIFDVGHEREQDIPLVLVPLIMLTTWMSHLFGGSVGREGVAVQIGATLSHRFSRYIKIPDASRIFLMTGMAAGFAGLFQTPLAATFFALEVLTVGRLQVEALYPALIASIVASFTSHTLGLEKFAVPLTESLSWTPENLVKVALVGLSFGLAGKLFALSLSWLKIEVAKWLPNPYIRIAVIGAGLSMILLILQLTTVGSYSGLGTNLIDLSFQSTSANNYDWILKLLFTVVTISAGYQGGEVTPLFAIGATLGIFLAPIVGLPILLTAAIGYTVVFGSATTTLFAPILIGGEVFGFSNLPFFLIASVVAYCLPKQWSIYSGQKLAKKDSK